MRRRIASLLTRMVIGACCARRVLSSATRASRLAGSTISLTKPAARPASLAVVIAVVLEFLIEWCRSGSK